MNKIEPIPQRIGGYRGLSKELLKVCPNCYNRMVQVNKNLTVCSKCTWTERKIGGRWSISYWINKDTGLYGIIRDGFSGLTLTNLLDAFSIQELQYFKKRIDGVMFERMNRSVEEKSKPRSTKEAEELENTEGGLGRWHK